MIKKRLAGFFRKLLRVLEDPPVSSLPLQVEEALTLKENAVSSANSSRKKPSPKRAHKLSEETPIEMSPNLPSPLFDARDMSEMMEVPFLSLSKNRKNPIRYQSDDGRIQITVTPHTGHFLASIYDWDIILFVASKMQDILNTSSDIPPRTLIIPRHEMLKALHKHDGKKQQDDLEAGLSRLKLTGIETTIRNDDYRYKGGFGFLDSWGYTKKKEIKEISITLSQWLYDGICAKGSLLKVSGSYFDLTSGLKRFLYRTARKHVGSQGKVWEFSVEKLYEKSGSEREFKKFKSDLKSIVLEDSIPEYHLEWINRGKKSFVSFQNAKKLVELALAS